LGANLEPIIRRVSYANLPTLLALTLAVSSVLAQDLDASGQAAQQAAQISQQASQQAIDQMNQASQQANQQAMQNAQQAALTRRSAIAASRPTKFSVKPGAYSAAIRLKMKDSTRGAVIY